MPEIPVYIIENPRGRLCIGHADNLEHRLGQHNAPEDKAHLRKYTHKLGPWRLIGAARFPSRSEARKRERQLKEWKSPMRVRSAFGLATIPPLSDGVSSGPG